MQAHAAQETDVSNSIVIERNDNFPVMYSACVQAQNAEQLGGAKRILTCKSSKGVNLCNTM